MTLSKFTGSWIAFSLLLPALLANAQEEGSDAPRDVIEQKMVIAASGDDGEIGSVQVFSSSGGPGGGFFFSDSAMMSSDVFALADNPGIQHEIELDKDQLKQLRDINKEFSERISEQVRELTSGQNMNPERGRELSTLIQEMNEEKKQRMETVLLPHQFERLRQIALQVQMKQEGEAATLASEKVAEALGIDDEQKKRLEARAAEIRKELEEKIARLREEARDELLGELSGDQRKKLTEMTGRKFDVPTVDFRERVRKMREERQKKDEPAPSDQ